MFYCLLVTHTLPRGARVKAQGKRQRQKGTPKTICNFLNKVSLVFLAVFLFCSLPCKISSLTATEPLEAESAVTTTTSIVPINNDAANGVLSSY